MSTPISLRPARPDDEPFLLRVFASTREDELKVTGWDEAQKAAFLRMQFDAQWRAYYQCYTDEGYEVILEGDVPIGRIFVHRGPHEYRIVDIALLPEHCNRGIGSGLVRGVLGEAAAAGKPVRLHVESFNPAHRLYLRFGFTPIGEAGIYQHLEWKPASAAP